MLVDLMYRIAKGCVHFIYNNQVPFFFFDQPWTTLFVAVKSFLWFGLFLPANEGIEATTGNTSAVRRLGLFQISLILLSFLSDPLLDSEKGKQTLSCLSDF